MARSWLVGVKGALPFRGRHRLHWSGLSPHPCWLVADGPEPLAPSQQRQLDLARTQETGRLKPMDLFAASIALPAGMTLLPARALDPAIWSAVQAIWKLAPPRKMTTPHGTMSVALTGCGECAWTADASGYRYLDHDPLTGLAWPPMPAVLAALANDCAAEAGFAGFWPDTCLINDYAPGTKMGMHRDADEADFSWPINCLITTTRWWHELPSIESGTICSAKASSNRLTTSVFSASFPVILNCSIFWRPNFVKMGGQPNA